ncbi:hypothetical protein CANARDRAFT_10329 [[Candida] arabinofermentans NRRL YB-2248]|uniref:Amino acid transporter transmembrane domain-containing protein n=1 Tax=[Candida] arabinofermentans NRRL YB-2248 TaxID=983967 RepID=A0A1E4ST37_9ASCO|nr:hypothetical protein CANARDRAFT_10329 [[Candida] arabinofermentans NRRL YB-2248]
MVSPNTLDDANGNIHDYVPSIPIQQQQQQHQQQRNRTSSQISRRSSVFDYGGENSLNNFASSVKRSVNFLATTTSPPLKPSSMSFDSSAIQDTLDNSSGILSPNFSASRSSTSQEPRNSIYKPSTISETTPLLQSNDLPKDDEREVIFIGSDGGDVEIDSIILLKSTPVQTVFNSINLLIGLGILSIPLAFHLSGWIAGIICLTLAALTTRYTAILLGRIQSKEPSLSTYQDIASFAFGPSIAFFVFCIFSLDLFGACVSMIVLFGDSFNAIFNNISHIYFKAFACILLLTLNFFPLRLLSILSLIGIICTTGTFLTIVISGLLKKDSPGSLLSPMSTNLFPSSFLDFCFSLGLYLAPWGGHAAFPEVYSDQQKPETYTQCMDTVFGFSYSVDLLTGVLGFLMFGAVIDDEVTKNILTTEGYPGWISTFIVILMGLLPLSKLPLACRPIVSSLDQFIGGKDSKVKAVISRVLISMILFCASVLITSFGKIMSLLGSSICFTVCITLPLSFYIKIFNDEISPTMKIGFHLMIVTALILTLLGSGAVLLATLGSKFSGTKISKRQIEEVSIPSTCQTIIDPSFDVPLRHTSSLLYGVALVYKQKADQSYRVANVLKTQISREKISSDVQNSILMELYTSGTISNNLDMLKQSSNRIQILRDDPNFNIDLGMLLPNNLQFDITNDTSRLSYVHDTSRLSYNDDNFRQKEIAQLDHMYNEFEKNTRDSIVNENEISLNSSVTGTRTDKFPYNREDLGIGEDVDFIFDENGNIVNNSKSKLQIEHVDEGVIDYQIDFDNNIFNDTPMEIEPVREPTVDSRSMSVKRVRNLQNRVPKSDRIISLSTLEMREHRDNYTEYQNMKRQNWNLNKTAIEIMNDVILKSTRILQPTIRNIMFDTKKRRLSRASSVSSIEEARRDALGGVNSRRNSMIPDDYMFDDFNRGGGGNNVDFEMDLECDDAILDISFPENDSINEAGELSKEMSSFHIGDGFDDLRNTLRLKRVRNEKNAKQHNDLKRLKSDNDDTIPSSPLLSVSRISDSAFNQLDQELKTFYEFLLTKSNEIGNELSQDTSDDELNLRQFKFDKLVSSKRCSKSIAADCFHRLLHLSTRSLIYLDIVGVQGMNRWGLLNGYNINIVISISESEK